MIGHGSAAGRARFEAARRRNGLASSSATPTPAARARHGQPMPVTIPRWAAAGFLRTDDVGIAQLVQDGRLREDPLTGRIVTATLERTCAFRDELDRRARDGQPLNELLAGVPAGWAPIGVARTLSGMSDRAFAAALEKGAIEQRALQGRTLVRIADITRCREAIAR